MFEFLQKPPSKYPGKSGGSKSTSNGPKSSNSKQIKFTNMAMDNGYSDNNGPHDIVVLYGTQKGTAKHFAETLSKRLSTTHCIAHIVVRNMRDFDAEDLEKESIVLFVVSTYENGGPPVDAQYFMKWIVEAPSDCRVHDSFLRNVRFGVFGLGNSLYDENYNRVSKTLYQNLLLLGAVPLIPLGLGDANVSREDQGDLTLDFKMWSDRIYNHIDRALNDATYPRNMVSQRSERKQSQNIKNGKNRSSNRNPNRSSKPIKFRNGVDRIGSKRSVPNKGDDDEHGLADLEDIGNLMSAMNVASKQKTDKMVDGTNDDDDVKEENKTSLETPSDIAVDPLPEMVTDRIRDSLSKQGYKVIGSHSGVKLCRWTKSMLRGRGGCYKNTFYGIKSYQCMEMTPSLACANKCVFCWRHHTNPVGKSWKWVMDEPEFILEKAMAHHKQMVKAMKGVPGVLPERLQEAQSRIRHCALSLVVC